MTASLQAINQEGNVLRVPPHNYESERALLGAILMNNRAYERVAEFLAPGHFADPVNGVIFAACRGLIDKGQAANPVTLKTILERDDLVMAAGGIKYLANLASGAVTIINAGDYGKLIYDLFLRRELIALGEDLVNEGFDCDPDVAAPDLIDKYETHLYSLRDSGSAQGDLEDFDKIADNAMLMAQQAYQHDGTLVGITTGLHGLDHKTSGLQPGDLTILAGRPSMGKTALATNIAFNAAKYFKETQRPEHKGKTAAFFSLEMPSEQLLQRILAERSGLDSFKIRSGRVNSQEFDALIKARQEVRGLPLRMDDTPAITVAQIRSRSRRLARAGGLGLIVIDYLQLISSGGRERPENRVNELSAITRGLKALAKELEVPVIALSQLSRAVEQREDKRPMLSDLRESGSIEQDADNVLFVYRDEYYLERAEPKQRAEEGNERYTERVGKWQSMMEGAQGRGEIIVAKQRQGPLGTLTLNFDAKYAHWWDEEPAPQQEELLI